MTNDLPERAARAEIVVPEPNPLRYALWALQKRKAPTAKRRARWRTLWEFEHCARALGPGDIAIDGGAHFGTFTARLARTGATVHAFEPDPYCFGMLAKAVGGRPNVHLHPCAVAASAGTVSLFRRRGFADKPRWRSEASSLFATERHDTEHSVSVEQIDLVAFVDSLPTRVALLKLDVEGAEVPILERLLDSNALSRIDRMFVETHEGQQPELAARTREIRARVAAEGHRNINLDWP